MKVKIVKWEETLDGLLSPLGSAEVIFDNRRCKVCSCHRCLHNCGTCEVEGIKDICEGAKYITITCIYFLNREGDETT